LKICVAPAFLSLDADSRGMKMKKMGKGGRERGGRGTRRKRKEGGLFINRTFARCNKAD